MVHKRPGRWTFISSGALRQISRYHSGGITLVRPAGVSILKRKLRVPVNTRRAPRRTDRKQSASLTSQFLKKMVVRIWLFGEYVDGWSERRHTAYCVREEPESFQKICLHQLSSNLLRARRRGRVAYKLSPQLPSSINPLDRPRTSRFYWSSFSSLMKYLGLLRSLPCSREGERDVCPPGIPFGCFCITMARPTKSRNAMRGFEAVSSSIAPSQTRF